MPFTLIRGTYHVLNYSPDGDSLRFRPENPQLFHLLDGPPARMNPRGHVQLRIEAIDALETHYSPPSGGGPLHQPLALARAARQELLNFVGIGNVTWDANQQTVLAATDGVPGYILTRAVEKYGRPVAFVFAGNAPEADGTPVLLDVARLRQSYNFHALTTGLAYATYYNGLFFDLRNEMTKAVRAARLAKRGVYAVDGTNAGVVIDTLAVITNDVPIMPKLFRRLSEYYVNVGSLKGFEAKLAEAKEPVLDLRRQHFTHFDTFLVQQRNRIRLTRRPEELVFDAQPTQPVNTFSALLEGEISGEIPLVTT